MRGKKRAIVLYLGATLFWGFYPVYWRLLQHVDPKEILAHRITWSLTFVLLLLWSQGGLRHFMRTSGSPKTFLQFSVTAALIALNWGVYIWAVNSGHVLESSFAYFLAPIATVLLGVLLLRERLSIMQVLAIGLAGAGVAIQAISLGSIPWVAVILASTIALYTFVRKQSSLGSIQGLLFEQLLLFPFAVGYLLYRDATGVLAFGHLDLKTDILAILAGVVTAVPFLLFVEASKALSLTTIGLMGYISPSMMFLLAVYCFGEQFTIAHTLSFACIWIGSILYLLSTAKGAVVTKRAPPPTTSS